MKKMLLLIVSLLLSFASFSQFNPETNASGPMTGAGPGTAASGPDFTSSLAGIPCDANSFWAVGNAKITRLTLNGNSITIAGEVATAGGGSLAWCDNLDGGSFTPTFYTNSTFTRAGWYNGAGWTTCTAPPKSWVVNAGGYGNFLYFTANDSVSHLGTGIVRYTGSAYETVYTLADTSRAITVADLSADDAGNVWFFIGNHTSLISDTLNVVSPSGQLLKQYPFTFNSYNAYGCFMMDGVIYIGLGNSNPDHPNTLVPVTVSGNVATAGVPIPMPATSYSDLAGCNPGSPLAVEEVRNQPGVKILPNPATDFIQLAVSDDQRTVSNLRIYNCQGNIVVERINFPVSTAISISALRPGIYFLTYGHARQKFIVK
jgi:hypothetical protein